MSLGLQLFLTGVFIVWFCGVLARLIGDSPFSVQLTVLIIFFFGLVALPVGAVMAIWF